MNMCEVCCVLIWCEMKIGYVPVCISVVSGVCSVIDAVDWDSVVGIVGVVSIKCNMDVVW